MRLESPSGILALTVPARPWQRYAAIEVWGETVWERRSFRRSAWPQMDALRDLLPDLPSPARYEAESLLEVADVR